MLEKANKILEEVKEEKQKFLLSIGDMQKFADDESDAGDQGDGGQAGGDKDGASGDQGADKGDDTKGGNDGSDKKEEKKFNQDDVNAIAAREAKKAQEKLLKQLGVKEFKDVKDALAKYQEIVDAQKTDAQKAAEKAKTFETENAELLTKNQTLTAELAALKADVKPDSVSDVVVLAKNLVSDDVTMEDAIGQVLKKYPNFKRSEDGQENKDKKPKFTQGDHNQDKKETKQEQWASAFNFGGLKN